MGPDTRRINIGDWVYSYSPGIWRVYRVLQGVQEVRFKLEEPKRTSRSRFVFSKRLVDGAWKPSFIAETASADVVSPLSDDDRRRLEAFIATNPQILQEFEAFEPEEIDFVLNLRLNIPVSFGRDRLQRLIDGAFAGIGNHGSTNDEILQLLAASELARHVSTGMSNATLQFLCKGHEVRNNEYVFREARLIMV